MKTEVQIDPSEEAEMISLMKGHSEETELTTLKTGVLIGPSEETEMISLMIGALNACTEETKMNSEVIGHLVTGIEIMSPGEITIPGEIALERAGGVPTGINKLAVYIKVIYKIF